MINLSILSFSLAFDKKRKIVVHQNFEKKFHLFQPQAKYKNKQKFNILREHFFDIKNKIKLAIQLITK